MATLLRVHSDKPIPEAELKQLQAALDAGVDLVTKLVGQQSDLARIPMLFAIASSALRHIEQEQGLEAVMDFMSQAAANFLAAAETEAAIADGATKH